MSRIKICGLRRPEDIAMVNKYLPDFAGFIINFPKSHRNLSPEQVRALTCKLDRERITAVGVFVDEPVENVAKMLNDGTLDMAQLHGHETEDYIAALRNLTEKKIIKAFAVRDAESLKRAAACGADYILLDQGQGAGVTFDWSLLGSDKAKEAFGGAGLPKSEWFLAGGLSEDNIAAAVEKFRPYAVDLSSAVETDKFKDEEKVRKVIEIVRRAK